MAKKLLIQQRYRVIKQIGFGGFGRTLLAVDEGESPPSLCVLKQFCLQNTTPEAFKKAAASFVPEALCVEELGKHPQIPALLAYFEEEQHLYWVQEFIEGINLAAVLTEEGVFSEAQIWQLLEDLLPVLKFVHDRQLIHQDIKPANIIRPSRGDRLFLVDFSAIKIVTKVDFFKPENSIGSPEYAAPEQAKGKALFASDLYSLGVTCIYLLTGISPFHLFDVSNDGWVWQEYLMTPVSVKLGKVLDKLIQNTVAWRFHSVEQVMEAVGEAHFLGATDKEQKTLDKLGQESELTSPRSLWHCINTLAGHGGVNAVAISPDGRILASGSDDKTVRLWEVENGELITILTGSTHFVKSVVFSPDGKIMASGSEDRTIKLWDIKTGEVIRTLLGHSHAVKSVAFSPCGKFLASGSWDKMVKVWDVNAGSELATLAGHILQVTAVGFSPCGEFLASASFDRTVQLWSMRSRDRVTNTIQEPTKIKKLSNHTRAVFAIAFSPDGKLLASGSDDNTIVLWDKNAGELIRTISDHSWSVVALAFTPDGEILISGSWDKMVKLWQVSTGKLVATLSGHSDSVCAIAVSPCGQIIASGSRDKTIKIWQRVE